MGWEKGQCGNPKGRPRGRTREIERCAAELKKYSPLAIKTLVEICRKGETHAVRLAAANSILDRAYGKPQQSVELTGEVGHQLTLFEGLQIEDQRILTDALNVIDHDPSGVANAIALLEDAS
jgi:hypothetical protein